MVANNGFIPRFNFLRALQLNTEVQHRLSSNNRLKNLLHSKTLKNVFFYSLPYISEKLKERQDRARAIREAKKKQNSFPSFGKFQIGKVHFLINSLKFFN